MVIWSGIGAAPIRRSRRARSAARLRTARGGDPWTARSRTRTTTLSRAAASGLGELVERIDHQRLEPVCVDLAPSRSDASHGSIDASSLASMDADAVLAGLDDEQRRAARPPPCRWPSSHRPARARHVCSPLGSPTGSPPRTSSRSTSCASRSPARPPTSCGPAARPRPPRPHRGRARSTPWRGGSCGTVGRPADERRRPCSTGSSRSCATTSLRRPPPPRSPISPARSPGRGPAWSAPTTTRPRRVRADAAPGDLPAWVAERFAEFEAAKSRLPRRRLRRPARGVHQRHRGRRCLRRRPALALPPPLRGRVPGCQPAAVPAARGLAGRPLGRLRGRRPPPVDLRLERRRARPARRRSAGGGLRSRPSTSTGPTGPRRRSPLRPPTVIRAAGLPDRHPSSTGAARSRRSPARPRRRGRRGHRRRRR